jgi:two-component system alkaline phosphatase synthesis response regulator PhoP
MKPRRILVVDDDVQATRIIKLGLERTRRYEVMELNNPDRAINAAHAFKPDLILLDVCMPCTEGVELAFQVRADKELQAVPVVFMTSLVSEQEAVGDGTTDGAFHFVAKPVRLQRVINCIEKSLETTTWMDHTPATLEAS